MITRVLVPLDGSQLAEFVIPYVEAIARASGAGIVLLAAVGEPRRWGDSAPVDLKGETHCARTYLETVAGRLHEDLRSKAEMEVTSKPAAKAIIDFAAAIHADLIAMTTHGRSGVARWVLGSVAAKVLHAAETPLLLVRPPSDSSVTAPARIEKILVPLDGSAVSLAALPFAEELARALGASLFLFHAVVPPVLAYPGAEMIALDARVLKSLEEGGRNFVTAAAAAATARGIKAEAAVSIGNAVDAIVAAAQDQAAGLIVMSTHGRSGAGRMVLGSVADAVVRRSSLPVVLVRPAVDRA